MSRFFGPVRQAGYVVRATSRRRWTTGAAELGIGPWFYNPRVPIVNYRYEGARPGSRTTRWRWPTPGRCRWS